MPAVDPVSGSDNGNILQRPTKHFLVLLLVHCGWFFISIAVMRQQINRHKSSLVNKRSKEKPEVPCKRRPALLSLARMGKATLAWHMDMQVEWFFERPQPGAWYWART